MTILPCPEDACPQCGATSISQSAVERNGVITANYCCAPGHIWIVKWNAEGTG